MKPPIIWNLQYHRTIHSARGTLSHDIYTLRRTDLNLPYYTVSVPHGNKPLIYELTEALNHRTAFEAPPQFKEIDAMFHGPWKINELTKARFIVLTEKDEKIVKNTIHAIGARLVTVEKELETLRKAYADLDRMYNLQSKVLQRIKARTDDEPGEDLPDLFKESRVVAQREIPQFEHSKNISLSGKVTKQ